MNTEHKEYQDMKPEEREFLESELEKFAGLTGVSTITEHEIVMKDDRSIMQKYYQRCSR